MVQFDYSKLKGRIVEKCGNQKGFAIKIKMNPSTLSTRLNNSSQWTQAEILESAKILKISFKEIPAYFFTQKV